MNDSCHDSDEQTVVGLSGNTCQLRRVSGVSSPDPTVPDSRSTPAVYPDALNCLFDYRFIVTGAPSPRQVGATIIFSHRRHSLPAGEGAVPPVVRA